MFQTDAVVNALQMLWTDTCDVFNYEEFTRTNKSTGHREVPVHQGLPCRLSFSTANNTDNSGGASSVNQVIKLFLAPDVAIPAGSKISITRDGKTVDYKQSGEPARYCSHQEIVLVLFDGWA